MSVKLVRGCEMHDGFPSESFKYLASTYKTHIYQDRAILISGNQ